jgi:hypothetical protein
LHCHGQDGFYERFWSGFTQPNTRHRFPKH